MKLLNIRSLTLIAAALIIAGCSDDDVPAAENQEEVINKVTLIFTSPTGGAARAFTYTDPDGPGTTPPIQDDIVLAAGTIYTMNISLQNTLGEAVEDISQEVREEGEEHQIFFGWTGALFTSPTGLGNIGSENQSIINYDDADNAQLPIGLATIWETAPTPVAGTFRILLKHQPGVKTEDSSSADGETDLDIEWNIQLQEE